MGEWPDRCELHEFTKGNYALHSQSIQQIAYQLLANVDATDERRRNDPKCRGWLKYPYKDKKFFPVYWPAQAADYDMDARRLVLPMGRGCKSLVFRLDLDFEPGAVKLGWNEGYELHIVRTGVEQAGQPLGENRARADLGEIHLAAAVAGVDPQHGIKNPRSPGQVAGPATVAFTRLPSNAANNENRILDDRPSRWPMVGPVISPLWICNSLQPWIGGNLTAEVDRRSHPSGIKAFRRSIPNGSITDNTGTSVLLPDFAAAPCSNGRAASPAWQ